MPRHVAWSKTLAVGLALTIGVLGLMEWQFRLAGFGPSVHDGADLWWANYRQIAASDEPPIVIAGSSRAQLGIDPATLRRGLDDRPVIQLAINGSSPLLIIEQLADDRLFHGTLLLEIQPIVFDARPAGDATPAAILAQRQTAVWRPCETAVRTSVQSLLVFRNPLWEPKLYPRLLRPATWHGLFYLQTAPDRSIKADYGTDRDLDKEDRWARILETMQPMNAEELARLTDRISRAAHQIQSRGGQVAMIYFPGSGATLSAEERFFPRAAYWDRLVRESGLPHLHLHDVPAVQAVYRPCDGSHLDGKQTRPFSEVLAAAVKDLLRSEL
ncbi:MAG: hypothetical protein SH850_08430 [Planctomycetaceae bacterium]|nr:hypothetical protein [Planctomycetaceae bacterium]